MAKRKPVYEPNLETLRRMKRRLNQAMTLLDGCIKHCRKMNAPLIENTPVKVKKQMAKEVKEAIQDERSKSIDKAALQAANRALNDAFFKPGGIADKVRRKK